MKTLFALVFLLSISGAAAVFFKRRIEETVAPTIFAIIIILYITGLLSRTLLAGVYVCLAVGGISLLYLGSKVALKDGRAVRNSCFTPGLIIFIGLFAWIWWINRYRVFSAWDEFSHWGLVVKNMTFFDYFGNHPDSTVTFRGYPPAMALWQYFTVKLYGKYEECYVYRAFGWLIAALGVSVTAKYTWKKFGYAVAWTLLILVIPFMYNDAYLTSLYVDAMLGILFGYILFIGFFNKEKTLFDYITLFLAISVLCMTKASGLFLALIAVLPLLIVSCRKREWRRFFYISIGVMAGFLIGKVSWSIYLKLSTTGEAWNTSSVTLGNIIRLLSGKGAEYQYTVISNFINALSQQDFNSYIFNMKYLSWVAVWGIAFYLMSRFMLHKDKGVMRVYECCIWAGLVVYTVGLLVLYIFTYSEYEAVRLASFQRYLATYFTGIAWFVIGLLRVYEKEKILVPGICVLLLFMPLTPVMNVTLLNGEKVEASITDRENYQNVETCIPLLDYRKDKVWIISQNDRGNNFQHIKYMLAPVKTNLGFTWSLGEPYGEGDIWTTLNYTADEWLDAMEEQNYTSVYLYQIDDIFKQNYSKAFADESEIVSDALYRLGKENGKEKLFKVR